MCDYYSKHNFMYEKKVGNPPHPNISALYSLHSFPYIFFGTDKENLFNNQLKLPTKGWQLFHLFS